MEKQLPKNWVEVTIPEFITQDDIFIDGDWVETKDQDPEGQVRLIQLADIGIGNFRNKSNRFMDFHNAKKLNCTFLNEGDILVARMPDPIGRACIFPLRGDNVTVVDVAIIRPNDKFMNNKLLMHFINSPQINAEISNLASGSTRQRISRKNLGTIKFPLPPIAEQNRIVAKLDTLFTQLENIKVSIEKIPVLLKDFRQQVLTQAVSGKFTSRSFVSLPSTITIGSVFEDTPIDWRWIKLIDVAKLESGHTPRKTEEEYWTNGNVPWISLQDIRSAHGKIIYETKFMPNELGIKKSSARLLPEGTVCFCRDISVGYTTVMGKEMSTSQHFANWICGESLNNMFLFYVFMSAKDYLTASGKGTTVRTIYMPALKDLRILIPPLEEQQEIVSKIERLLTKADVIEKQYQSLKLKVDMLPKTILHKAFKGELTEQFDFDGNARELLDEIKRLKSIKLSKKEKG